MRPGVPVRIVEPLRILGGSSQIKRLDRIQVCVCRTTSGQAVCRVKRGQRGLISRRKRLIDPNHPGSKRPLPWEKLTVDDLIAGWPIRSSKLERVRIDRPGQNVFDLIPVGNGFNRRGSPKRTNPNNQQPGALGKFCQCPGGKIGHDLSAHLIDQIRIENVQPGNQRCVIAELNRRISARRLIVVGR